MFKDISDVTNAESEQAIRSTGCNSRSAQECNSTGVEDKRVEKE